MKYYLDPKNEDIKNVYITDVSVNKKNNNTKTYSITYANGEVEDNVEYTDRNTAKIEDRLNKQIKKGIDSRHKLKRNNVLGSIGRIGTTVCLSASSVFAMNAASIGDDSFLMTGVAGTILLGGVLLSVKKFKDFRSVINDINDIETRLNKTEAASQYLQTSPNAYLALDGKDDNEKVKRATKIFGMLVDKKNPFSLCLRETGEGLSDGEVDSLFSRNEREKKLGFTYTNGYPYSKVASETASEAARQYKK